MTNIKYLFKNYSMTDAMLVFWNTVAHNIETIPNLGEFIIGYKILLKNFENV